MPIVPDPNNTMAVNGQVHVDSLQKDIDEMIKFEFEEDMAQQANFDDTIKMQMPKNRLAASTKLLGKEITKANQEDNMLKYQISDDKEENDLLESMMGLEEVNALASTQEKIQMKDGQMISTEQHNKTQIL